MSDWITYAHRTLRGNNPAVLVTVARVAGSAPREAGARLVVSNDGFCGNIGGGNLEHTAIDHARGLLGGESDVGYELQNVALGPNLGQCCGGRVTLVFEVLGESDSTWLDVALRATNDEMVVSELSDAGRHTRLCGEGEWSRLRDGEAECGEPRDASCSFIEDPESGVTTLAVKAREPRPSVMLFGAGHVGKALVVTLKALPVDVVWVDSRPEMFTGCMDANVVRRVSAIPESDVADAPPNAHFLVMTHDHGLDREICAAVLERGDFAYLGLIGSKSKRRRFMKEFRVRGLSAEVLARLTCPIGVKGISGKRPETIAVAVAAQLLQAIEVQSETSRFCA